MNSIGKCYPSSRGNQDENLHTNVDKNQAIIQKQNEQLAKLREYFVTLRNRYHDERRDFAMKSINLQRAIDHAKRKGDQLEIKINEIRSSIENAENEKNANDLIERIWCILKSFRKEVFNEVGEDVPSDNSFSIDNPDNDIISRKASVEEHLTQTKSNKVVKYGSSAKITKSRSKSRCSNRNLPMELESDSFDSEQSLPSTFNMNSSGNGKYATPSSINIDVDMTPITPIQSINSPITPSSTSDVNEALITPMTPSSDNFCDSIASRRTRRKCTTNVYYKEPSLRNALTPGDPFTFSLEDGIVTPTVPSDYSRDTPSINAKRRGRKNH